jgi:hypothetical protein
VRIEAKDFARPLDLPADRQPSSSMTISTAPRWAMSLSTVPPPCGASRMKRVAGHE